MEEHVLCDVVATSEPVIEIKTSTAEIKHDIVSKCRLRCLGLKEGAALLFPDANLMEQVIFHNCVAREGAYVADEIMVIETKTQNDKRGEQGF